ncbi:Phage tail sheath protein [Candidatus Burkholderia pumila]|uniref:Phage tail sheath protein n=1 Tax=Candidatus Burkholderia pumila TaxID=1090375 RepID=A0ABR5HLX9_9BURK|nr:Phage tail sheath protein [Candidatus Burkholderia pumila]
MQAPAGANYTTTSTSLNTTDADGYGLKVFVGDWVTYFDSTNNQNRLLGPTTFWAERQAALSPERSSLNKPLYGIVSTQRTVQSVPYTSAEIGAIKNARLGRHHEPFAGRQLLRHPNGCECVEQRSDARRQLHADDQLSRADADECLRVCDR